jgi:hypothetical protein
MKLQKTLALVLCWASLFITLSSKAQVDSTTGNLINFTGTPTATTSNWNNGVYVNQLGCFGGNSSTGYCGPYPNVQTNGNINFSYGQVNLNQIVNINTALAAGGSGVQLSGFNFAFTAKNGNGWDDGRQDYLSAYVKFFNSAGGLAANYDYTSQTNQRYNWTNFNFNETFATPVLASQFSTAQVGFIGKDNNYWAGPYGPEINNVSFSLKYRVDPCALNAAYSPNCAGFNNIIESNNLFNSNAWGQSMVQMAAVNVALQNAGIGAQVHGINYSFDWAVGNSQCTSMFLFWCDGWTNSNINVNVRMNTASNSLLLNRNYGFSGENVSGRVEDKFLLPSTMNQTALGYVGMASSGWGDAQAGNFRASLIFTPDPCTANPLYSTQCSGYAVAYAKNMLLGSTVASASGPIVSSGSTSMSSNTGTIDQSNPLPDQQQTQQPQQTQQQQSSPPPQDATQQTAVAQMDPSQPSPTQAGPASTSPQPAGGPAQTTTASASTQQSGPGAGPSAGPSKLAMSVLKASQEKDKATQQMAVQNAAKTLENATQSSQASSNLAISINQDMSANSATAAATFASQQTQTSQQTATQTTQQQQQTTQTSTQTQQASRGGPQLQQQQQETQQAVVQSTNIVQLQAPQQQEQQQTQSQTSSSVVRLLPPVQQEQQQTQSQMTAGMMPMPQSTYTPPQQQTQETQSTQVSMLKPPAQPQVEIQQPSSGTGLTLSRNPFAYNPLGSINVSSMTMPQTQPAPTFQFRNETKTEIEAPQMPVASFSVSRAGNPLSEILMQQRFESMQSTITPSMSSVNKNAQSNELAGGVDIASIATVPSGFNAYSIVLKDAAFYEPKEVYKNQRTVDNERVLRGLTRGSDSLHQRMVDQQYKGN